MIRFNRPARLVAAGVLYSGLAAAAMCRDLVPAQSQTTPETPKQVYQDRCSACHNAYDPAAQGLTLTQWRRTVNRMLYVHGASAEITPADTQTILTYLATFAVPESARRPGLLGGARRVDNSDVWTGAPSYSRVFVFGADPSVADSLQPASSGIAWKVLDADTTQQLVLRAKDNVPGPYLLLVPVPSQASGGLRVEAVFGQSQVASAAPTPLSFGLAIGSQLDGGSREYDMVRYEAKSGVVDLITTTGKATQIIEAKTVDAAQLAASRSQPQHTLRVDVFGTRVKAWLDYNKVIDTELPQAPGSPAAGVWTGSRAIVKSLAVDFYPAQG